jgi:hypothetical protein
MKLLCTSFQNDGRLFVVGEIGGPVYTGREGLGQTADRYLVIC